MIKVAAFFKSRLMMTTGMTPLSLSGIGLKHENALIRDGRRDSRTNLQRMVQRMKRK